MQDLPTREDLQESNDDLKEQDKNFSGSKLYDESIIKSDDFKKLEEEKIIIIKDGILKVSENNMIKLNSIIDLLINS